MRGEPGATHPGLGAAQSHNSGPPSVQVRPTFGYAIAGAVSEAVPSIVRYRRSSYASCTSNAKESELYSCIVVFATNTLDLILK
jgi:hypothetical protein